MPNLTAPEILKMRFGFEPNLADLDFDQLTALTTSEFNTLLSHYGEDNALKARYVVYKLLNKAEENFNSAVDMSHLGLNADLEKVQFKDVTFVNKFAFRSSTLQTEIEILKQCLKINAIDKKSLRNDFLCESINKASGALSSLDAQQRAAISNTISSSISIINGPPGSGKSKTINAIVSYLHFQQVCTISEIGILCSTNKAKSNYSDLACSVETVHKALVYNPYRNSFSKSTKNPLPYKFVLVDECSMLDSNTMLALLNAVGAETTIVLVGDGGQLGAVGVGDPFYDICKLGIVPLTKLTKSYRTNQEISLFIDNVRSNKKYDFSKTKSTHIIKSPSEENEYYLKLLKVLLRLQESGVNIVSEVQILAPLHNGLGSVNTINQMLHRTLTENSSSIDVGDKIIIGKTALNMFQGEQAVVTEISKFGGSIKVVNERNPDGVFIRSQSKPKLSHCLTIHESQGSEWTHGIVCISKKDLKWIGKRGLITAASRFKLSLTFFTDATEDDFVNLISNERTTLSSIFGYEPALVIEFLKKHQF